MRMQLISANLFSSPKIFFFFGFWLLDNSIIRFPNSATLKWEPGHCYDQKKSQIPLILRLAKYFQHLAWFLTEHLTSGRKRIGLKAINIKPPHFTRCYPIKLLFQYSNQLTNILLCPLPQKQQNTEEFPVLSFETSLRDILYCTA